MSTAAIHGREGPLATLRAALAAAQEGRGRLLLVSGDPGIGKSALAAHFAAETESAGVAVTWGRAWEFADAPPYFPIWPCLRELGVEIGANRGEQPHGEDHGFHMWEAALTSLAARASRQPLVWIIEDLHA